MSTIGSTNGLDTSQLNLLQQLKAEDSQSARGIARAGDPEQGAERMWSRLEAAASELGMDTDTLQALQDDLRGAVSTAMESVDDSATPEERRQAVEEAVLTTLEENGIDAAALKEQFQAMAGGQGQRPDGPPPGGAPPDGPPPGGAPPDGAPPEGMASDQAQASESSSTSESDLLTALLSLFPLVDEQA
ncbi:MAG: hypothetical protein PVJ57_11970 [Phycisphaerae bacterium]